MPLDLTYFVSYARADKEPTIKLLELLQPRLAIARGFRFAHWIDDRIGLGERWNDEIGTALAACDFGLMLLSPAFFASGFIRREELPHFIEQVRDPVADPSAPARTQTQTRIRKPLVPVILKPIPMDGAADLAGLEQLQIFRDHEGGASARPAGIFATHSRTSLSRPCWLSSSGYIRRRTERAERLTLRRTGAEKKGQ